MRFFLFFVKPVIFATIAAKIARVPRIVGMIEGLGGAFTVHKNGQTKKAKIIKTIQVLLYKISLLGLTQEELKPYLDSGVVIYPGFVNDIKERIVNSSIFVLPSYYREGVPRSTQEAMAIGRAVITTNSVGCRETVEDGVNGFLVPPFDSKILAQKMIYFIQNPEMIVQMGIESRKIAEIKFNINEKNERLAKIIRLIFSRLIMI